jgi:CheY-like chemotaxis protein
MMPDVTGFDVVATLQRDPDTEFIPILVVTAKNITPADRRTLNPNPEHVVNIVGKLESGRVGFLAQVQRAILPV